LLRSGRPSVAGTLRPMHRDFGLTEDQREIVGAVREFVRDRMAPAAAGYEEKHEFPRDLFAALGGLGLCGIPYEERYGGGGQPFLIYLAVLEEIAAGFLSLAITLSVHHLSAAGIHEFGSDALKQRYLPKLFAGEWLGAYALSEASSGSDAAALRTRADRTGDGSSYRLTGSKRFISSAGEAELYLVMARTGQEGPKGVSAFAVEKGWPGFEFGARERKMGWWASPMRELLFEACDVPAENLVGEEGQGFTIALAALDSGRLGIAACATGLAQAAFDASVSFTKDRTQFGRSVIEFEGLQFMLADMATQIEASRRLYR
jgi:alkylation response protein AidB-like acyl-CoA dehydrogenase